MQRMQTDVFVALKCVGVSRVRISAARADGMKPSGYMVLFTPFTNQMQTTFLVQMWEVKHGLVG